MVEPAFFIALLLAIPILIFPAAFIWYLNIGGIVQTVREVQKVRAVREKRSIN